MNDIIDKYSTHSRNLGKSQQQPSIDLNVCYVVLSFFPRSFLTSRLIYSVNHFDRKDRCKKKLYGKSNRSTYNYIFIVQTI